MIRFGEALAPRRLGIPFRWLMASTWTSNLGDGIGIAAGPLLIASQTRSPFLVALGATFQWLPPMLFGLFAGVLTDRVDRRRIVIAVDLGRTLVFGVLVTSIVTDHVSIVLVLATLFVLGTAETFGDNALGTLLPMLVHRDDLAIGNSRLQSAFVTMNQLAGPPLGAALFAVGAAWAFAADGVLVLFGALLIVKLVVPRHDRERGTSTLRNDVVEGVRFVLHHAAVRTLVLTILIFNVTFGAAWSVLVLYATRHLGLGPVGFGLVTTVGAVGGLAGTLIYGLITRYVSLGNLMRIGLIIETLTHLGLALTTVPWVALVIFFFFGMHAFVWGTTSVTVRQRAVPSALQGRVNSVNVIGVFGGLVIGSAIGGAIAERWGVTGPFWFAFGGSAVFVVLIWKQLSHVAHNDEAPTSLDQPLRS